MAALAFLVMIGPFAYLQLRQPKQSEAAWFNGEWGYRQRIGVTVSSSSSNINNLNTLITLDTSTLITNGKLQSSCQDLRFTNQGGKVLPFYIDSGCNTTTTKIWVEADLVPQNTTTYTMYVYYGNPSAPTGTDPGKFWRVRGLAGYWKLNESGSGVSASDSSVNGNTLTDSTSTAQATGQYGNGTDFERDSGQYKYVADNAALSITSDLTLSVWIKPESTTASTAFEIIGKWDGLQTSYVLAQFGDQLRMVLNDSPNRATTTASVFTAGNWYHVVGVYSASAQTIKLYVNGQEYAATIEGTIPASITDSTSRFHIGAINSESVLFGAYDGIVDDVRVYNRSLSSNEVSDLYTNPGSIASVVNGISNPTTSFATEETTPGPIAYWKFDDGTGTTAQDETSNNNDGTLTNGPTWQTEDQCINGKCLKFDGSNDYVSITDPSNGSLDPGTSDFSLSLWIKPNTISGNRNIIRKGAYTASGYSLWVSSGGILTLNTYDGTSANLQTSSAAITENQWSYITISVDRDGTSQIFVNGQSKTTSGSVRSGSISTSNDFTIGQTNTAMNYFQGHIDEVKFYPYARSAAQIKTDFLAGAAKIGSSAVLGDSTDKFLSDGLVGYWKMDESSWTTNCSTGSVLDYSGNANNGRSCPTSTGPSAGGAGKFGNSASLDGSDDHISVADPSSGVLDFGSSTNFTLSSWVKATSLSNTPYIIDKRATHSGTTAGYTMHLDTSGRPVLRLSDGTTVTAFTSGSSNTYTDGGWHLTVISIDRSGLASFFVDGQLIGTSDVSGFTGNIDSTIRLGFGTKDATATNALSGSIDEARVYNRALSADEIRQLYNWAPGPMAHYKLDEHTGTSANDVSGNTNTGTLTNGPTWDTGKYGSATKFDGTDDYITANDSSSLSPTSAVTVEAWINPDASPGDTGKATPFWGIATKNGGVSGFPVYGIRLEGTTRRISGGLAYGSSSGENSTLTTTETIPLNTWTHVAFTYDQPTAARKIYINGKLSTSSTSYSQLILDSSSTFTISLSDSRQFSGKIDDVRVYNYARTTQQIVEDMNAGHPTGGSPVGTQQAYWRFNEQQGQTANNTILGGYSGTLGADSSSAADDPTWKTNTDCKVNGCLDFESDTSEYVTTAEGSGFSTNTFSITTWIKPESLPATSIIADNRDGTSDGWLVFLENGLASCDYNSTRSQYTGQTMTAGQWHHIACVSDGSTMKVYVNGVLRDSETVSGSISESTNMRLGARSFTSLLNFFDGSIDEFKFYNSALTVDQVRIDYNQGAALNFGTGAASESATLSDGSGNAPVGEWKFEEKQGTSANDTSGNGSTGTLTSGPAWTTGKYGGAVQFDGSDDYITAGTTSSLGFTAADVSISAWFNTSSPSSLQKIAGKLNGSAYSYGLDIIGGTNVRVHARGSGSAATCAGSYTIPANTWIHALGTIDDVGGSTTMKIYVNGVLLNTCTGQTTITTGGDFYVGATSGPTNVFTGKIDQVKVWNYILTPAQVAYDYNGGAPIGHWRMDECQGSSTSDSSGNSNTGTITIGSSGTQASVGTCNTSSTAWGNGATGKYNSSLNLDGTDDYVTMGDVALFDIADGQDLAISGWVYRSTFTTEDTIIAKKNSQANTDVGYELWVDASNDNLLFRVTDSDQDQFTLTSDSSLITSTGWHHFVVVFDEDNATNSKIYFDGVDRTNARSGTIGNVGALTNSVDFRIGSESDAGAPFIGQIDDVRIYNYALSGTQVKQLFNQASGVQFAPSSGSP